jgi:EAL domain-containing protein (putative c-di-GMP-specific phosphodiesterase class I)
MAGDFIKAAERIGLINKLDLLLVEKAFLAANEKNYQGKLFINISPKAFILPDFLPRIQAMSRKLDIDPGRVVFEVTERDTVSNIAMLQKFVSLMKKEGFKFAIDDFGSGYSSFKYLKLFPIDYIKIEGDFIRNLNCDSDCQAYVKSIVTLARELKIKTVAEQIEDEAVYQMASIIGIDLWQGYFRSRPAADFLK